MVIIQIESRGAFRVSNSQACVIAEREVALQLSHDTAACDIYIHAPSGTWAPAVNEWILWEPAS